MDIYLLESIDDCYRMGLVARMPFFEGWRPAYKYLAAADPANHDEVVGLICFKDTTAYVPDFLGLTYLTVARAHRNKGVATALAQALFARAKAMRKGVFVSAYEPDGRRYLRKVLRRTSRSLKVPLLEFGEYLLSKP